MCSLALGFVVADTSACSQTRMKLAGAKDESLCLLSLLKWITREWPLSKHSSSYGAATAAASDELRDSDLQQLLETDGVAMLIPSSDLLPDYC